MRSPYWNEIEGLDYDSTLLRRRLDEVTAGVLWQRLAPAFADGQVLCSAETLTDRWLFKTGECWVDQVFGQEIHQTAPAVIARALPLPQVEAEGERPFVTCAQNPNGALSVTAHRRLITNRQEVHTPFYVTQSPPSLPPYMGVFGYFRQVALRLPVNYRLHIMAKEELFHNRFVAWFFRHVGVFPVERGKGDKTVLNNAIESVRNGRSMLIFPEGTRNKKGEGLLPLKSGAFVVAEAAHADIVPCRVLYRGGKQHPFCTVTVAFGEPIPIESLQLGGEHAASRLRAAKGVLAEHLEKLYEENKAYG